jgi:hypothetical protein
MNGSRVIRGLMAQVISYCKICPRIESHIHYSNFHDALVKVGVAAFILAEIVAFVGGAIKGSTELNFDYSTIASYKAATDQINQLIAVYQPINYISYVFEVGTLLFAVVAGITLHSSSKKKLHRGVLILAFVFGLLTLATRYYYNSLTAEALAALPTVLDQGTLSAYAAVEQQFQAAYGFWGAPADSLVGIMLILSVASLGAASATTRPRVVWTRDESNQQASVVETAREATAPDTISKRKYCRYCGAGILKASKFCEECGKSLAG